MGARILIIDDEPDIRVVLEMGLTSRGFVVQSVATGKEALDRIERGHFDIVLLDLMLPDMSGVAIIERVRTWSTIPILVLSVLETEPEKVRALNLGADDYLTKPFGLDELIARIQVTLRRMARSDRLSPIFRVGDLAIDFERHQVVMRGKTIVLTPTEYAMLKVLAQQAGRVLTYRSLLQAVWGPVYDSEISYLHVYISRLRRKLEIDPARPHYVMTEPGAGYRLSLDPDDALASNPATEPRPATETPPPSQ